MLRYISDDDSYLEQQVAVDNLGEISIEIWRVAIIAASQTHGIPFPEDQKVHERSKKALAHRVKWGMSCPQVAPSD